MLPQNRWRPRMLGPGAQGQHPGQEWPCPAPPSRVPPCFGLWGALCFPMSALPVPRSAFFCGRVARGGLCPQPPHLGASGLLLGPKTRRLPGQHSPVGRPDMAPGGGDPGSVLLGLDAGEAVPPPPGVVRTQASAWTPGQLPQGSGARLCGARDPCPEACLLLTGPPAHPALPWTCCFDTLQVEESEGPGSGLAPSPGGRGPSPPSEQRVGTISADAPSSALTWPPHRVAMRPTEEPGSHCCWEASPHLYFFLCRSSRSVLSAVGS